ncbi:uncharacterized protein [Onthophagus taurus]|uniref:uncharacterized protein n=1 Tax=Onthophagus taurus TaxID=166361 RepID=UPI000C203FA5|nr:uncharacterized protein LOC111429100 [Onthophagus taurus]
MAFKKSLLFYIAIIALVFAILQPEVVEARRKVLRGRRTVTRSYYRPLPIPAWAIVGLVGLGQLIIGVIAFFIMKKTIIDPPLSGSYTPAATA